MQNKIYSAGVALSLVYLTACGTKSFSGLGESQLSSSSVGASSGAESSISPTTTVNPPISQAPATEGNTLVNGAGQHLSFMNKAGRPVGGVSVTGAGGDLKVDLLNTYTGRRATVEVKVDPASGAFESVGMVTAQPYMCHDPSADPCAMYVDATTNETEYNCNSPIYFRGALSGSVANLDESASISCGRVSPPPPPPPVPTPIPVIAPPPVIAPAPVDVAVPVAVPAPAPVATVPLCQITIASGRTLRAKQPVKELCQAICRDYASDSTVCRFKGEVIPYGFLD